MPWISSTQVFWEGSAKQVGAAAGASGLLVEIDKNSGAAHMIGEIGFKEVFGLANGPHDTLYGIADGKWKAKADSD